MKLFALILFFNLLASCASNSAKQVASNSDTRQSGDGLHHILEAAFCPNAGDFRGIGIGASESEALAQARSNMALEHFSQKIESSIQITGQNINEIATTIAKVSIDQKVTLINPQDAKQHFSARHGKEIGVVACMGKADAAKPYRQMQIQLQDSIELISLFGLKTTHPKEKNEARIKTNSLWIKIFKNQELLKSWGMAGDISKAKDFRDAMEDNFKDYCQTAKLYWNPEKENLYSNIAFAKLSQKLKIEKSLCTGKGISLVYKNYEHKCEHAGIFNCSHQPSLSIASCEKAEYMLLKTTEVGSFHQRESVALERLQSKFRDENFWNEWEQEIKQWRPQCE